MPNPYTAQAISGYNSSPPPDDGSATSANTVKWATHKNKLADPIKTLTESINTELITAFASIFGNTYITKSTGYTVAANDIGKWIVFDTAATLTLLPIATAGDGFPILVANLSTGIVTIDGNSSETIIHAGATGGSITLALDAGRSAILTSDGSAWVAQVLESAAVSRKIKTATTPHTSDDTLSDDPHLAGWAIEAASRYEVDGFFQVFQNAGNFQWQFSFDNVPVSGGLWWNSEDGSANKASDFVNSFWLVSQDVTTMADGSTFGVALRGCFESHATLAATLDIQAAQETSNSSPTNFLENSWLNITKV